MKTLLILRHAKSGHDDPTVTDHERPLNERGKRDAPRVGKLLGEIGPPPDLILCSTAKRTRATAKRVIEAGALAAPLILADELYHASAEGYLAVVRQQPDHCERILLVGHNPGLEELYAGLTGRHESLPTAALAVLALDIDSWQAATTSCRATSQGIWRPRDAE